MHNNTQSNWRIAKFSMYNDRDCHIDDIDMIAT